MINFKEYENGLVGFMDVIVHFIDGSVVKFVKVAVNKSYDSDRTYVFYQINEDNGSIDAIMIPLGSVLYLTTKVIPEKTEDGTP